MPELARLSASITAKVVLPAFGPALVIRTILPPPHLYAPGGSFATFERSLPGGGCFPAGAASIWEAAGGYLFVKAGEVLADPQDLDRIIEKARDGRGQKAIQAIQADDVHEPKLREFVSDERRVKVVEE